MASWKVSPLVWAVQGMFSASFVRITISPVRLKIKKGQNQRNNSSWEAVLLQQQKEHILILKTIKLNIREETMDFRRLAK